MRRQTMPAKQNQESQHELIHLLSRLVLRGPHKRILRRHQYRCPAL